MSQETADIVGTTGASFTFTISSATIVKAYMADHPDAPLAIGGDDREVTIPKLPAGDSLVVLALVWGLGEPDVTIDVGTVISGTVEAADPKGTIDRGKNPGYVELFGK